MSNQGDEPATNEPDPSHGKPAEQPDGQPDGDQGSQDEGARHKRKKRPHLRALVRALFFATRVLWWWLFLKDD